MLLPWLAGGLLKRSMHCAVCRAGWPVPCADTGRVASLLEEAERQRLGTSCANSAGWAAASSIAHRLATLAAQWRRSVAAGGSGGSSSMTQQAVALLLQLQEEARGVALRPLLEEVAQAQGAALLQPQPQQ